MSTKDLVGIFLASSGSRGDHLLFRYPYETDTQQTQDIKFSSSRKNRYAMQITEDWHLPKSGRGSCIVNGVLVGFSDKVLSNLMAVKAKNLCGSKFEVTIDDVIFVGHPLLLHPVPTSQPSKRESPTIISFNVVFVLQASVDIEALSCYHDLAKQLAIALRHEERRCGLLSKHKNIMWAIQDDVAAMPEDSAVCPYRLILEKCHLAQQLKQVYDEVCSSGVVQIYINKWIHINWCLPQKVYTEHMKHTRQLQSPQSEVNTKPHSIHHKNLIQALRPYHGMLLLVDENTLLESLPIDTSPSLLRLVRVTSPFKNLHNLASDADISLAQVYQLVIHLVYWSKATIIYPLCETNIYVLSPNISTFVNSFLVEKFLESFPGASLPAVLAEFSVPTPLGDHKDVLGLPQQQAQEVQMVSWLLQHGLLVQLHTYVFLIPHKDSDQQSYSKTLLTATSEDCSRLRKTSSNSDINSFNSDESQSVSNFSAKSPSLEGISDVEEMMGRSQWHLSTMSTEQVLSILKTAQGKNTAKATLTDDPDDLKLLGRLSAYFNGKHHLEEIMYKENVRRSQLLTLLDKFRDVLITCQHEDPGLSGWFGQISGKYLTGS